MSDPPTTKFVPKPESLAALVFAIRGEKVPLDADLAMLYGVETGALNRAVKRKIERFPDDFMFQLNSEDWENLRCQIGISSSAITSAKKSEFIRSQIVTAFTHGGRRVLPYRTATALCGRTPARDRLLVTGTEPVSEFLDDLKGK